MKAIKKEQVENYVQAINQMKENYPSGITTVESTKICASLGISRALLYHLKRMKRAKSVGSGKYIVRSKSLRLLAIKLITEIRNYSNENAKKKYGKMAKIVLTPPNLIGEPKEVKPFNRPLSVFNLTAISDAHLIQELKNRGFKISKVITQEY